MRSGPLAGIRVVEFAGIGPAPFAAMMLADMGADVIRVARPGGRDTSPTPGDVLLRGRPTFLCDLKTDEGRRDAERLFAWADASIEGFRPGVMERLGLGPVKAHKINPGLIYGRMTGFGQTGPRRDEPGHDITYTALSGALSMIGTAERPVVPLNLAADFGGGGMFLVSGILAALVARLRGETGQVVDAAMTDGAAALLGMFYGFRAQGRWSDRREENLIDGGAPFYGCYRCADGEWFAVGAIEPEFYEAFRQVCGLEDNPLFDAQHDKALWPAQRARVEDVFAQRSRADWSTAFAGSDACGSPVLDMSEAPEDTHSLARGTFIDIGGVVQPAPAPRFEGTPVSTPTAPGPVVSDLDELLGRTTTSDLV